MSMSNRPNPVTDDNKVTPTEKISYPKIDSATPTILIPINTKQYTCNELIDEFERVKEKILQLNNELHHNERLLWQYDKLIKGRLYFKDQPSTDKTMSLASDEFAALIEQYKEVIGKYEQLKKSIPSTILPQLEVDKIEESVSKAGDKKRSLRFYADEQERFEKTNQKFLSQIEERKIICEKIKAAYESRALNYMGWHKATSFMSLLIFGLPFFVGGVVVHAIDTLITNIKLKIHSSTRFEEKIENDITNKIEKDIKKGSDTLLRQSIFKTAQAYYSNDLDKIKEKVSVNKPKGP